MCAEARPPAADAHEGEIPTWIWRAAIAQPLHINANMIINHGTNANDYAYSTYTSFASTTAVNYIIVKANSGNLQGFGTATLYGIRD